ncbi:MAG: heme-binding protein [Chloroflexi bacterium]|nr:heme-binding protein [Chloroflexota bacterium]
MYQTYNLSHADALKIVAAIQAELENTNRAAAIAVADAHGELIAFLRLDGCKLPSLNIAINKAFTAAREGAESKMIGQRSREDGFPMTNFGDLRYTAWGGGVPLTYQGKVIGAVGVSGVPEEEDMALARLGVKVFEQIVSGE